MRRRRRGAGAGAVHDAPALAAASQLRATLDAMRPTAWEHRPRPCHAALVRVRAGDLCRRWPGHRGGHGFAAALRRLAPVTELRADTRDLRLLLAPLPQADRLVVRVGGGAGCRRARRFGARGRCAGRRARQGAGTHPGRCLVDRNPPLVPRGTPQPHRPAGAGRRARHRRHEAAGRGRPPPSGRADRRRRLQRHAADRPAVLSRARAVAGYRAAHRRRGAPAVAPDFGSDRPGRLPGGSRQPRPGGGLGARGRHADPLRRSAPRRTPAAAAGPGCARRRQHRRRNRRGRHAGCRPGRRRPAAGAAAGGIADAGRRDVLDPSGDARGVSVGQPFAGLAVPGDVTVSRQVLAQPAADLDRRSWAKLSDGTPLVTHAPLGSGQVVLFHVTATGDWSSLPFSGLFVQMLHRLVERSVGQLAQDGMPAAARSCWRRSPPSTATPCSDHRRPRRSACRPAPSAMSPPRPRTRPDCMDRAPTAGR